MKLTDNEKRDVVKLIEEGKTLPEKYRFLLFEESKQVEITWNGKSDEITNVVLPFQTIEQIDEPRNEELKMAQGSFDFESGRQITGWSNKLIWGDNKYILSSLKNGPMRDEIEREGGIKLIYIDPPFDVGADFSMKVDIGDDEYEKKPNILERFAYSDTWGLGPNSFLSMIYERLILMKDLLSDDGVLCVHIDWRLKGSIRLILQEIFGASNFVNEIIWHYGGPAKTTNYFPRKYDSIIVFSKNGTHTFNKVTGELPSWVHERKKIDKDGREWIDQNLGKLSNEKIEEMKKEGRVFETKTGGLRRKQYLDEMDGSQIDSVWDIPIINSQAIERLNYPTQKSEELIERLVKVFTNENDLVADFFSGSGTTAAVSEKLNRKWICSDIGKFAIHTTRKRMIGTQRNLKKLEKNWRAFEVLNLGKYQIQHYIHDGKTERDKLKKIELEKNEREFEKLILEAYKAESVAGFSTLHGKKGSDFVSIGPINLPLSRNHVEEVISECIKNKITSVDILGFEYEMGLFPSIQEEAKLKGLRLSYKQIPMDVFDKTAVTNGDVIFHNIAHIDFDTHLVGNNLHVELTGFAVFYNEDNLHQDEKLQTGKPKIMVENGEIVEKSIDKNGKVKEKILTENWYDWIDYWSVDFDFESKKEFIKIKDEHGEILEEWTGNYIFENEWQSFRQKNKGSKSEKLDLKSSSREMASSVTKVAVKVVDIFGNDTMKVVEVNI